MARQKHIRNTLAAAACLAALLQPLTSTAAGGQLFRYENDDGIVVLSSSLPPRYAPKGYTILDTRGRVVRVVPRQLTPEEAAQRELELAEERRQREAEEAQRRRDQELLRLYKSPSDVQRARDRQIATIEDGIGTTETNIERLRTQQRSLETRAADAERLRTQQRSLETRAADAERAGVSVRPELIENLRQIKGQIEDLEGSILSRRDEIEQVTEDYAVDEARLRELLGIEEEDLTAGADGASSSEAGGARR